MISISKKDQCCGCTACFNTCPVHAIKMQPDDEGFLYPSIDLKVCINCGKCDIVCPINNKKNESDTTTGYIARVLDRDILRDSTSGGLFTVIATEVIENGGVVFGAGYNDSMQVVCKRADTVEQLAEMRGSKFVQSTLNDTFLQIKSLLQEGKYVLFTGTPCQNYGLQNYLNHKPDNLFCMDFVCRGVPSPMLWDNYVKMMENKYHSRMISAKFKNKTYGYHGSTMKIDFANGKTWYGSGRVDPMMKAFVKELASRPSCSNCHFKSVNRCTDITMFDCYHFAEITGHTDDGKGYSSLFVHSDNGKNMLESIRAKLFLCEADIEKLVGKNGVMVCNSAKPNDRRDEFYKYAKQYPIDEAMNRINPITPVDIIVEKVKRVVYRLGILQLVKKLKRKEVISVVENKEG